MCAPQQADKQDIVVQYYANLVYQIDVVPYGVSVPNDISKPILYNSYNEQYPILNGKYPREAAAATAQQPH